MGVLCAARCGQPAATSGVSVGGVRRRAAATTTNGAFWMLCTLWLAVALLSTSCTAGWFRLLGPRTINTVYTVDGSYHLVTISNIIIDTNGVIDIRVGDMVTQQGKKTLTAQLCSITIRNGGLLLITGGSQTMTAANSGPFNFVALNLVANDGGIAFSKSMPYASVISLSRPRFTRTSSSRPSYGTYLPGVDSLGPRAGLVFYSLTLTGGSFLLYGQPDSLTANTFDGTTGTSNIASLLFYGANRFQSACMFHLFQLSSVNGVPILGGGGLSISLSGGSVFFLEDLEARYCGGTTCVNFGNIALSSSSFFLISRAQFQGSGTAIAFSATADSSANWFGIMANTFDLNNAMSASFSGSYMSVYGNYYGGGWSMSASTAYEMCTSYQGSLTYAVSGAYHRECVPGTLCSSLAWQCYTPLSRQGCIDQKPSCVCSAGASTAYCIPFNAPKIPTACISTNSMSVSASAMTITEQVSEAWTMTATPTYSATYTQQMSITESKTASPSNPSLSDAVTASDTPSQQTSVSRSVSANSNTQGLTLSTLLSPTIYTYSRERSASFTPSRSSTPSSTYSSEDTASASDSASQTTTESMSPTRTITPHVTPSHTVTKSLTPSVSSCDWLSLSATPVWPVRVGPDGNESMEIAYLDFRDYGAAFMLDDLGQWWVDSYRFTGVAANVTLFTTNQQSPPIIPKRTEADFHAVNPVTVGVFLDGFGPTQFYNSELIRKTTIAVTFKCSAINKTMYWSVTVLPLPAPISAAAVQTTARSAILASTVLATPYGNAIAALTLNLQQLYLCQAITDVDQFDITRWKVGDDERAMMRGAILGNLLIVAGQALVMCLVIPAAIKWNLRIGDLTAQQDFFRLLRVLQLPTSLHITVSAVLQLVMAASVSLFRMSSEPGDVILGVVGILLCVVYVIVVGYRAVRIYWIRKGVFNLASLDQPIRRLPREEDEFLFGEYDKPWFAAAETVFLLLVGVTCGTPPAAADDCSLQVLVVAFLSLVSAVVLLVYQPMRSTEGQVAAFIVRVLTVVMCGCTFTMSTSRTNQVRSMQGAAMCLLLLATLSLMRALFDIRRAVEGLPRLVRAVFRLKVPEPEPTPDVVGEPTDELPQPPPVCPSSGSSSEEEFIPQNRLQATDVVGFLGHTREEVVDVDDLLMAYGGGGTQKDDLAIRSSNDRMHRALRGDFDDDDDGGSSGLDGLM